MAKKKTWHFDIKKSKNKSKFYIKITAGNGEPFLAGQMLKGNKSAVRSVLSMIEAVVAGRYRITANMPNPKPKKKK